MCSGSPCAAGRRRVAWDPAWEAVGTCFGCAGRAFGGPGVRLEKPLLLGISRKTSLQKCLGTEGSGNRGSCANERRELQDSNGRIQTQKKPL